MQVHGAAPSEAVSIRSPNGPAIGHMKAIEEWLRPLAYQGGNERDENATDEPECPFPLDDNDDQAIQGAVATLQTLAVSFVLMFSFVCRALPSARRRCMCLSRGTGRRVQSISRCIQAT